MWSCQAGALLDKLTLRTSDVCSSCVEIKALSACKERSATSRITRTILIKAGQNWSELQL